MRENPLKQRLAEGGTAFGTMVFEFFTPGMAAIAAAAGAEFVLYDMEHSGAGIDTIKAQFAACRGLNVVPMVRVPTTQYHFIARCLDAGAHGIMVPMVESVAQAKDIVSFTRYPPKGIRGAGFGMAHDDYTSGSPAAKIEAAHRRTLVIAQIETPRGAEAVDEIAAIDGIDVVWLGHFDMTNFMGIPGQFTHPDYLAACERIVAAARRHGKTAGFLPVDETWSRDYFAKGFRIMAYGLDSLLLQQSLSRGLALLRELANGEKG
jgi:2-dehydro-3-deoxyglucarate aldolase/4-hydroxy-2-oxoheptanedioate aldolase